MTNRGAISTLDTLRSINSSLAGTQSRISTGLRISTASDNAAYWSIATTMRADTRAISAVADSIGLGQGILDTAYAGMQTVYDYMVEARNLMVMAANEGTAKTSTTWHDVDDDRIYDATNLGKIDRRLRSLLDDIALAIDSSSFAGVNLLKNELNGKNPPTGSIEFVTGLAGSQILTTTVDFRDTVLINYNRKVDVYVGDPGSEQQGMLDGKIDFVTYEILGNVYDAGTDSVIRHPDKYVLRNGFYNYNNTPALNSKPLSHYFDIVLNEMDVKISKIRDGMTAVGATLKNLKMSAEFVQDRIDTSSKGIGRLVDADMDEESTRLKALQTQQQLGIQALQIANASTDKLIELFR
ncbi:flagellin [Metarhizobium album]|uniref:flagellin N-terminal helical domain-containing protein n=1 Tax=Metarhizobium album TaxID=2182425 RepID=UPI001402EF20|nr:flagellin [Rhizobium album]